MGEAAGNWLGAKLATERLHGEHALAYSRWSEHLVNHKRCMFGGMYTEGEAGNYVMKNAL